MGVCGEVRLSTARKGTSAGLATQIVAASWGGKGPTFRHWAIRMMCWHVHSHLKLFNNQRRHMPSRYLHKPIETYLGALHVILGVSSVHTCSFYFLYTILNVTLYSIRTWYLLLLRCFLWLLKSDCRMSSDAHRNRTTPLNWSLRRGPNATFFGSFVVLRSPVCGARSTALHSPRDAVRYKYGCCHRAFAGLWQAVGRSQRLDT